MRANSLRVIGAAVAAACWAAAGPARADSFELELLHVFHHTPNSSEGARPAGPVHVFADGSVIGTTESGGAYGGGTVFLITAQGELKVLHQFTGRDGLYPDGCLVPGKDGSFYGTVHGSQTSVFRINTAGDFAIVYRFKEPAAEKPQLVSIKGSDGNVYAVSDRFVGGFRLFYAGERALTEPDVFSGSSTTVPGGAVVVSVAPHFGSSNDSHDSDKAASGGVSVCAEAAVGVDGYIYKSDYVMHSIMRSFERGAYESATELFNPIKMTEDQRRAAGVVGQVAALPGGDLVGIAHWQFPGEQASGVVRVSPSGNVAWIAPFPNSPTFYLSPGLVLGADGNLYGIASYFKPGHTALLQITLAGKVSNVLSFPPEADLSTPGPLTAGPDGSLYGALGFYGEGATGAIFRIVRHH